MSSEDCGPAAPKFPYGLSLCILIKLFFDGIAVHPSAGICSVATSEHFNQQSQYQLHFLAWLL